MGTCMKNESVQLKLAASHVKLTEESPKYGMKNTE